MDNAAKDFLLLLKYLRVVILQDAVIVKARLPHLPIWLESPFNLPEFATFENELKEGITATPNPFQGSVASTAPDVARTLQCLTDKVQDYADVNQRQHQSHATSLQDVAANVNSNSETLQEVLTRIANIEGAQQNEETDRFIGIGRAVSVSAYFLQGQESN